MSFNYYCIGSKSDQTRSLTVTNKINGKTYMVYDNADSSIDMIMKMIDIKDDNDKIEQALNNIRNFRKLQANEFKAASSFIKDEDAVIIDNIRINKNTWDTMTNASDMQLAPLRKFLQRLDNNPSALVKVKLLEWVNANGSLSLTEDGLIIGYRAIQSDRTSLHQGYGEILRPITEGNVEQEWEEIAHDHLPNHTGNIVKMPREMVDHDPNNSCSFGLHIGTWDYAKSFSPPVKVLALFDPADVVCVPENAESKLRVCKYLVGPDTTKQLEHFAVKSSVFTSPLGDNNPFTQEESE